MTRQSPGKAVGKATSSRERILDGAVAVMRERGLAYATTKEIARAAGVSEALLYKVFDDKVGLFLDVLAERLPRVTLFNEGLASQAGRGTVAGNVRRLAGELVAYYVETFPVAASVFSDAALLTRHREALREREAGPHRVVEAVADYLRAEQHAGRVSGDANPSTVAELLVGACLHRAFLASFQQQRPSATTISRFAAEIAETLRPILA